LSVRFGFSLVSNAYMLAIERKKHLDHQMKDRRLRLPIRYFSDFNYHSSLLS